MPPRSRRKARKHPASPLDQLTSQQLTFVRFYVSLGASRGSQIAAYDAAYDNRGGTDAARRSSASKLLKKAHVKAAIDNLVLGAARVKSADRTMVMAALLRNSDAAFEKGDYQASNRALELLGKAIGDIFNDHGSNDDALDLVRMVRELAQGGRDGGRASKASRCAGGR
jgi:hypothetical protein